MPRLGCRCPRWGNLQNQREPYRARCRAIAARLRQTLDYVRTIRPQWTAENVQSARDGLRGAPRVARAT